MDIHRNDFDDELPPVSRQPVVWSFVFGNVVFFAIALVFIFASDMSLLWLAVLAMPAYTAYRILKDFFHYEPAAPVHAVNHMVLLMAAVGLVAVQGLFG